MADLSFDCGVANVLAPDQSRYEVPSGNENNTGTGDFEGNSSEEFDCKERDEACRDDGKYIFDGY